MFFTFLCFRALKKWRCGGKTTNYLFKTNKKPLIDVDEEKKKSRQNLSLQQQRKRTFKIFLSSSLKDRTGFYLDLNVLQSVKAPRAAAMVRPVLTCRAEPDRNHRPGGRLTSAVTTDLTAFIRTGVPAPPGTLSSAAEEWQTFINKIKIWKSKNKHSPFSSTRLKRSGLDPNKQQQQ